MDPRALSVAALLGFSQGAAPVDPRSQPELRSPARCGECHEAQYAAWRGSGHGRAWTNDLFAEGLRAEPLRWCVNCHAPLPEQGAQVDLDGYRRDDLAPRPDESLAEEGVGCPTCHVRDGAVLTPTPGDHIHPSRYTPELRQSELCAACHEFPLHTADGAVTDVLMQSTYSEWRAWGGSETCQSCHMPAGDHSVRGAHDVDWLRQSVVVDVASTTYTVRLVGVGHALPSGDVFRHLTLEEDHDGAWTTLATFGRSFVRVGDAKQLATDTSLRPGPGTVVPRGGGPWRLRYHYASALQEAARRLPEAELVVTLHDGR